MKLDTDQKLAEHLRTVHGITDGIAYDPDIHADVPAICFGTVYRDGSAERQAGALSADMEPDSWDSGLDEASIEALLRVRPSADRPVYPYAEDLA